MRSEFIIHWPYLALAAAMLWFPRPWYRLGRRLFKRRRRHLDRLEQFAEERARDPDDKSVRMGVECRSKRNWLDLLRAAAGGVGLMYFAFELPETPTLEARRSVFGLQVFVTVVGTLLQCIRREEKVSFFAPIFYLVGLSAALGSPSGVLFSLLLMMAINPIIPNPRVFLGSLGLLMLPFGVLFSTEMMRAIAAAALTCLPPLISLLAARPLVIYSKRVKPA